MTFYITAVLAWPAAALLGCFSFEPVKGDVSTGMAFASIFALVAAVALALLPFLLTGRLA